VNFAYEKSQSKEPGLLLVARSPFTAAFELSRRQIPFESAKLQIPQNFCVIKLNADPIVIQRRVVFIFLC
jgi:hypothetical protein